MLPRLTAALSLITLVGVGIPVGSGTASPLAAEEISASDLDVAFGGTWEFSLVGTTPGMSQTPATYTKTKRVLFANGRFDKNPEGFESSPNFRVRAYQPGGTTIFESPYSISGGGEFPMTFNGKLSPDGNQISGKFDFTMASGTFTAVREACIPEQPSVKVPLGEAGEIHLRLTLKPDAPVTVHVSRLRGDKNLSVPPDPVVFTPDNWDQSQVVEVDASTVTKTGKAAVLVSGDGVPDETVAIRLVHAEASSP